MPEFRKALKQGGFFPEDYGFILEYGKGEASELMREKMKLQYRCDHSRAIRLACDSHKKKSTKPPLGPSR
jgi:hypothetical protein